MLIEKENIGYHIAELLLLKNPDRIIFREITYNAIVEAIQKPEQLCVPMIEAYQARRIIDRLIGYQISPLLWDKWGSTSSAGRTQSIVLHFITEKQKKLMNMYQILYFQHTEHLKMIWKAKRLKSLKKRRFRRMVNRNSTV